MSDIPVSAAITTDARPSLAGLSLGALRAELEAFGLAEKPAKMRAAQIRRWIHGAGVLSFDGMTNIAKGNAR